ncbi:MAG: ribosome small subunit biosis GTPase RsgA [Pseudomonadota bacterium]
MPLDDREALVGWGFEDRLGPLLEAHPGARAGRVVAEHAGLFRVVMPEVVLARPTGKLRARIDDSPLERPVVGDWVVMGPVSPGGESSLLAVLERRTLLVRKDPSLPAPQPIAANVDVVLIVAALGGELNPRRVERYLAAVRDSGAEPVVVLTKKDLVPAPEVAEAVASVKGLSEGVAVVATSALDVAALGALSPWVRAGRSVAFVGSSGVGKSTLINLLLGETQLATGTLGTDGKGRHTTTQRSLLRLPGGALVVDTPGMRELSPWSASGGVDQAFPDVEALAAGCRFSDCLHDREPGCAVRAAVEAGSLPGVRHEAWRKLQAEQRQQAAQRHGGGGSPRAGDPSTSRAARHGPARRGRK